MSGKVKKEFKTYTLFCGDCQADVIITSFADSSHRFLCPKCKTWVIVREGVYQSGSKK